MSLQVIEVPGYTQEEKVEIASRHLMQKQLEVCVACIVCNIDTVHLHSSFV